jgi:hypothetical protein
LRKEDFALGIDNNFLQLQEQKAAKAQEKANEMNDPSLGDECKIIQDFLLSNIYPHKFSPEVRQELRRKAHNLGYKLTTPFDAWWEERTGQKWNE